LLRQNVDQLSLAFITPLGAEHYADLRRKTVAGGPARKPAALGSAGPHYCSSLRAAGPLQTLLACQHFACVVGGSTQKAQRADI
jgi:hypothetical protein